MARRSVPQYPNSSASKYPSMCLKQTQTGSATLYPRKDVTKYLNKFRSRSVSTFLSKTAAMFLSRDLLLCLSRNAKLYQGDTASQCQSRGQELSPPMYLEKYVSPQVEDLEEQPAVDWLAQGKLEVWEDLEEDVELEVIMEVVGALEL